MEIHAEFKELRASVRRFVEKELEPWAAEIDRTGTVPDGVVKTLRDGGYLGMRLPEEYGGTNLPFAQYCLVLEEFSRSHRVFTIIADGTSGLTPAAILRHGTAEQRQRYLPGLADGSLRTAFGLTEPEAGSDAASIRTRVERKGNGWVINGRKHYINGADVADFVMVVAVSDAQKRARGGITTLLVDKGTPGFAVTRVDTTIGSDAIKLAELTFEDCFVPDDAVLGPVGDGFKVAMGSLTDGRLGVSCSCLGAADRLIEMGTEYAQMRSTFGQKLAERQAIQWMLADSAVELQAARALCYETLRRYEAGDELGSQAGMCKLYASEMVGRVADRIVQIHGGGGVIRGFPVERFYRDVRHYRIGEGSSEIQRSLIARDLFKRGRVQ